MTSEARKNWIFLCILLVLLLPGAVLMFVRKLQPTDRPMFTGDPVRRTVAYMDPESIPPGMRRVKPMRTSEFVEALVRERVGDAAATRPKADDGLPLMSSRRGIEVAAINGSRAWLIVWNPERPVSFVGANEVDRAAVALPRLVREELGANGILRPPHEVLWVELRVESPRITARLGTTEDQAILSR